MKGSTLHRSGLTKEKMGVLASLTQPEKKSTRTQLSQYYKATKSRELDLLWGGSHKNLQKVRSVAKLPTHRTPIVYISIGFVAGVLFMSLITLMISVFSMSSRDVEITSKPSSKVEVISETAEVAAEASVGTEKYIVKKGDTLNGIAYRFYGKYSEEKINEIQKINNIKNPAALSIGQELIIPVSKRL